MGRATPGSGPTSASPTAASSRWATLGDESARRTIDADGLYVCPGFIDMHTHSDLQLLAQPEWDVKLAQGVTLEVLGQDGLGLAPLTDAHRRRPPSAAQGLERRPVRKSTWTWRSRGGVPGALRRHGRRPTSPSWCGHGTVRMQVMGMDNRAPTDAELARMQAIVPQAMQDGAVGLSAGLTYAPAVFSNDDELVALCESVRDFGGYYAPHHRNYGAGALEAYAASIDIGRRAGVAGPPDARPHEHAANRGRARRAAGAGRRRAGGGVDTTLDTYPYLAGNSYLHANLPTWAHEGGNAAILARLDDPDARDRIRHELEDDPTAPVDWTQVFLTAVSRPENRRFVGHQPGRRQRGRRGAESVRLLLRPADGRGAGRWAR